MVTVSGARGVVDQHRAGAAPARSREVLTARHQYEMSVAMGVGENLLGRARGNAMRDLDASDRAHEPRAAEELPGGKVQGAGAPGHLLAGGGGTLAHL